MQLNANESARDVQNAGRFCEPTGIDRNWCHRTDPSRAAPRAVKVKAPTSP